MWLILLSTAARSTSNASSRSRGGPKTLSPASCMAPYPTRCTRQVPRAKDPAASRSELVPVTSLPPSWVGVRGLAAESSSSIGRYHGAAQRGGRVADEEGDDVRDRLRLDGGGHHLRRQHRPVLGGGDELWGDGVDPDPMRAELDVEGADQVHQRRLRQAVGGVAGGRLEAWPGRHMDDGARAPCLHVRGNRLAQPERGAEVNVHQLAQAVWRDAQRVADGEGADRADEDVRCADLA